MTGKEAAQHCSELLNNIGEIYLRIEDQQKAK
jgi:hypothetical protein